MSAGNSIFVLLLKREWISTINVFNMRKAYCICLAKWVQCWQLDNRNVRGVSDISGRLFVFFQTFWILFFQSIDLYIWFFHLVLSVLHMGRLSEGSFSIAIIWKVLSWVLSTWDNLPSVYVVFIVERISIFAFCHFESRFFFPAVFFTSYRPAM
jgi:hypothetical protein